MSYFSKKNSSSSSYNWRDHTSSIPDAQALLQKLLSAQGQLDINPLEVEAIAQSFELWAQSWIGAKVIIFIDNTTAFTSLSKQTLAGASNFPLRRSLLLAAKFDILIEAQWLPGSTNTLAAAPT